MALNQYEKMDECLNHLQFLLWRMGVNEFTISRNNRSVNWELTRDIDTALLDDFYKQITQYTAASEKIGTPYDADLEYMY